LTAGECNVVIKNSNLFTLNYADNSGGGIKWDDLEPDFDTTNTYSNNFATLYGDDIACFAEKMIQITTS
jgi:hypothetical protein